MYFLNRGKGSINIFYTQLFLRKSLFPRKKKYSCYCRSIPHSILNLIIIFFVFIFIIFVIIISLIMIIISVMLLLFFFLFLIIIDMK